jgi:hypothetical protein
MLFPHVIANYFVRSRELPFLVATFKSLDEAGGRIITGRLISGDRR